MSDATRSAAVSLLYAFHHELEQACAPEASSPSLGAAAGRVLDALKLAGANTKTVRRAESILLDLQRVEMSKRAGDGRYRALLVSSRDAARMIVADVRRGMAFDTDV